MMEDKLKESQIHTSNLHTSSGSLSNLSLIFTALNLPRSVHKRPTCVVCLCSSATSRPECKGGNDGAEGANRAKPVQMAG